MSQTSNTIFYRARHRRGIDWATLYARTSSPLNWWQSCLVGACTGVIFGLIIFCCLCA